MNNKQKAEVFDKLSSVLVGTEDALDNAIEMAGLDVSVYDAERILNDSGFGRCAVCGTWADIIDEECEFCAEDMTEDWDE